MKNNLFYFVQLILPIIRTRSRCSAKFVGYPIGGHLLKQLDREVYLLHSSLVYCIQVFLLFGSFRLKLASVRDLQPCKFFFQTFHLCVIIFFKKFKTFIRTFFFYF